MRSLLLLAVSSCLLAQTSNYPGGIDTPANLFVTKDNLQTALTSPMLSGDSVAVVQSTNGWAANMIATICDAQNTAGVCTAWEHMLVTAVVNSSVLQVTRAFAGTTAVAHASGLFVSANIDGAHQSVFSSAIQAIENLLGINAVNVSPTLISTSYNFAQAPGNTLSSGSCSFTLSPLPRGMITGDPIYLSGGIGSAETVTISGISGTTVTATCGNGHSGGWTATNPTSGIQKAINSLPSGGGQVFVPGGTWPVQTTITIPISGVSLIGAARIGATLSTGYTGGPLISLPNAADQITLANLNLAGPGSSNTFAIAAVNQANLVIEKVGINGFGQGVSVTGNSNTQGLTARNVLMNGITGDGVYMNTTIAAGTYEDMTIGCSGTSSTGFHVVATVGLNLLNTYTNGCHFGGVINPQSGQVVGAVQAFDAYFDGYSANSLDGILIDPGTGGVVNTLSFFGGATSGFTNLGIAFAGSGTVQDVYLGNFTVSNNGAGGIGASGVSTLTLSNLFLNNCWVEGNSSASSGTGSGLLLQFASNVVVHGGVYAAGSFGAGLNTQGYGITVGGSTSNVLIDGPVLTPNVAGAIQLGGTNTNLVIKSAIGYNPVGISTVTCTTGTACPSTAPSSPATLYITGGTVTDVKRGGTTVCSASPCTVILAPGQQATPTFTGSPTFTLDVQ